MHLGVRGLLHIAQTDNKQRFRFRGGCRDPRCDCIGQAYYPLWVSAGHGHHRALADRLEDSSIATEWINHYHADSGLPARTIKACRRMRGRPGRWRSPIAAKPRAKASTRTRVRRRANRDLSHTARGGMAKAGTAVITIKGVGTNPTTPNQA